ncbi:Coiled-coil domain-containing protein 66 [Merluccius polli]|uniref:Coiled-coil domain-containing protein 66 n=1 Tax=Merluccius polli TaxID=89951 RepID=A0AA47P6U4_MERPO|nr:Coiled-coil domain-containing protein 66 [Merluccius polli]
MVSNLSVESLSSASLRSTRSSLYSEEEEDRWRLRRDCFLLGCSLSGSSLSSCSPTPSEQLSTKGEGGEHGTTACWERTLAPGGGGASPTATSPSLQSERSNPLHDSTGNQSQWEECYGMIALRRGAPLLGRCVAAISSGDRGAAVLRRLRQHSSSLGYLIASGLHSSSLGYLIASGLYSSSLGYLTASGLYSSSLGYLTASGLHSSSLGYLTASGLHSSSLGYLTASGLHSSSLGYLITSGLYSSSLGYLIALGYLTASGLHSSSLGYLTASGLHSSSLGYLTASGLHSSSLGYLITSGLYSSLGYLIADGLLLQLENGKPRLVLLCHGEKSGVETAWITQQAEGPSPLVPRRSPLLHATEHRDITQRLKDTCQSHGSGQDQSCVSMYCKRSKLRPRVPSSNRRTKTPANGRTGRTDTVANGEAGLTNQEPAAGSPPLSPDHTHISLSPEVSLSPEEPSADHTHVSLSPEEPAEQHLASPSESSAPTYNHAPSSSPAPVSREGGEQLFLRSMTALLDPAEREERERRRSKQLEQLRAIEAQLAERLQQRESEEKKRREQEEEEEKRRMEKEQEELNTQQQVGLHGNRPQPIRELQGSHDHVVTKHHSDSANNGGPKGGQGARGAGGDLYQEVTRTERRDTPRGLPAVRPPGPSPPAPGPSSPPPQLDFIPYIRTADIVHLEPLDHTGTAPPLHPNTHSHQKEILQSLAALRQGLLQKQRELETGVKFLPPVTSHHR